MRQLVERQPVQSHDLGRRPNGETARHALPINRYNLNAVAERPSTPVGAMWLKRALGREDHMEERRRSVRQNCRLRGRIFFLGFTPAGCAFRTDRAQNAGNAPGLKDHRAVKVGTAANRPKALAQSIRTANANGGRFERAPASSGLAPKPDISLHCGRSDEQGHVDLYADHSFR
jgi:hypothetical protein